MVNVYIKERINDQITICAGGVTSNTTYLGYPFDLADYSNDCGLLSPTYSDPTTAGYGDGETRSSRLPSTQAQSFSFHDKRSFVS